MRNFELTLARRFGWKAEGARRVSPAIGVAIAGMAMAVVVMLLSLAVMLGFKDEVQRRIMNLDDCITISAVDSTFTPATVLSAITLPSEAQIVEHTSLPAILKTPDDFLGLTLQRNDEFSLPDTSIIISEISASKLQLQIGDRIPTYFFINDRLRVRMLTLTATYSSGFAEHDDAVGYCSASLPPTLLGFDQKQVQSLGIRNIPAEQIPELTSSIYSELLNLYYSGNLPYALGISNILQADGNFFTWLQLLDTNVIVIITLMGLVAAFTLISSLFIIILERVHTIGLLKSLGATNGQIRRIFIFMAERLVVRGLLIGNMIGLAIIAVQYFTHMIPLDATSYYVEYVPVRLTFGAFIALNCGALIISWLVLTLPALLIARISPATTLRYE